MAQNCLHKGCGKAFTSENEECIYHPGPPVFHEGQKGWKCCKPRVLTFDEFLAIPPCTTGKHSTVDDTPAPEPKPAVEAADDAPRAVPSAKTNDENTLPPPVARVPQAQTMSRPSASPAPPESESDDPSAAIPPGATCRRRGCGQGYNPDASRDGENCVYHPGQALFHEGSKGWTCCKRRVLEFDEFMKIAGCKTKPRHLFVGSGKKGGEEKLGSVRYVSCTSYQSYHITTSGAHAIHGTRNDFYQTPASVIASLYLKKIDTSTSSVTFTSASTIDLDLHTSDGKRYQNSMALFATIDPEKSSYKIMGTKLELTLAKADGASWPVLRADDQPTGEIIQMGRAGRA
ncbi:hypothetical protein B0A49_05831 [Cryomyces minteri]|uniref:Uncharacterized protein n=1 Tax=Cryomyces minteri TaxID=331657 RepID=A0A4U0X159_9PEZI|nr:hypothetical protein B0A49_05831 [Cryomyces minteri]